VNSVLLALGAAGDVLGWSRRGKPDADRPHWLRPRRKASDSFVLLNVDELSGGRVAPAGAVYWLVSATG